MSDKVVGNKQNAESGSPHQRIPTLDGLRAISILMVILAHQFIGIPAMWPVGGMGVRIFFLISGFIITLLLEAERTRTGSISLGAFYFRRTRRIFPACYAYVLVVLCLSFIGVVRDISSADFAAAITYTVNFYGVHDGNHWLFGHLWSLGVEEQFYLLWPLTFMCVPTPMLRPLLASIVLLVPFLRLAIALHMIPSTGSQLYGNFDTLALGCLLALTRNSPRQVSLMNRIPHWFAATLFVSGLGASLAWSTFRSPYSAGFSPLIANLAIAVFVAKETYPSHSLAFRFLNSPLMVNLGLLSYSLYIWQQPFVYPMPNPKVYSVFPVNYLMMFSFALMSFYLVEKPFRSLRLGRS